MNDKIEALAHEKINLYLNDNLVEFWKMFTLISQKHVNSGIFPSIDYFKEILPFTIKFIERVVNEYEDIYCRLHSNNLQSIREVQSAKEVVFKFIATEEKDGFISRIINKLKQQEDRGRGCGVDGVAQKQFEEFKETLEKKFDIRIEEIKLEKAKLSDKEIEKEILTILNEEKATAGTGIILTQKILTDDYGLPADRVDARLMYLKQKGYVKLLARDAWQITASGEDFLRKDGKKSHTSKQKQETPERHYDNILREKYHTSNKQIRKALRKIENETIESIIEEDIRNAVMCLEYGLYKSAFIASGSAIEGIIGAKLRKISPMNKKEEVEEMVLYKLLNCSDIINKVGKSNIKIADGVREYRNYVHPLLYFREIKKQKGVVKVSHNNASMACQAIFMFLERLWNDEDFKKFVE